MITDDHLIVLLTMPFAKMSSEVRGSSVYPIEIVGDAPWDLELVIDAVSLAAGTLGGGVAKRKTSVCSHA